MCPTPFGLRSEHAGQVEQDDNDERDSQGVGNDAFHGDLLWLRGENAEGAGVVPLGLFDAALQEFADQALIGDAALCGFGF